VQLDVASPPDGSPNRMRGGMPICHLLLDNKVPSYGVDAIKELTESNREQAEAPLVALSQQTVAPADVAMSIRPPKTASCLAAPALDRP